MKKFISLMLCVCICLSSTAFCFADFTSTDSTTLSNIYKYMPTASQVTNLNNTLSTISTRVLNIYNALFDSNHSIAYWVHAIDTFMNPILTAIQNTPTELESIKRLLGYVSYEGDTEVIDPYLAYQSKGVAQWVSELSLDNEDLVKALTNYRKPISLSEWTYDEMMTYSHRDLLDGPFKSYVSNHPTGRYIIPNINGFGSKTNFISLWNYGSPLGNIAVLLDFLNDNVVKSYYYTYTAGINGYDNQQTFTYWNGETLSTSNFTPSSAVNGLYTWLSKIQEPVARLSYVLASDQDIEAREKAADTQAAVVDNFIDSSGSGAASTSDFGSVSDLSSGFKNNISTDASVSGIWNIFNSDNFGWFSQETADQLDTTGSGNRTLRSYGSYPTPLLDQQTEDILKYIGGDDND